MKRILIPLFFASNFTYGSDLSKTYWSTYACDGYIYHFNESENIFKIYSRIEVSDKKGSYSSYQLTEGDLERLDNGNFSLRGKDLEGTLKYPGNDRAYLESAEFGRAELIMCNSENAKKLINSAEKHFKKCPKNVLNCKGL